MSATLFGHVTLQSQAAASLVIRFFTPDTDTEIHKSASITDADGNFYVYDAPVGTYDVGIKSEASLSLLAQDAEFTEGNTTEITFGSLLLGDLIHGGDEDHVSTADYNLLMTNYDIVGPCYGYAGDWLLPECPVPPPAGASYGYIVG